MRTTDTNSTTDYTRPLGTLPNWTQTTITGTTLCVLPGRYGDASGPRNRRTAARICLHAQGPRGASRGAFEL